MPDKNNLQLLFFFILFGAISVLVFFMFQPLFQTIFLAIIFSILFFPFYKKILPFCFYKKGIAAGVVTITVIVFIAIPAYILAIQIFEEAVPLYFSISENSEGLIQNTTVLIEDAVRRINPDFVFDLRTYAENFSRFLFLNTAAFFSKTAAIIPGILLFLLSFFFFLKDGDRFAKEFVKFSPLDERNSKELLSVLTDSIHAVVRGSLFVAIVQGMLVGLSFYIFQVPEAVLWGTAASIASLIPMFGTGLITIPAVLYLVHINDFVNAVGLAILAIFLVGIIDNILAPILYKRSGIRAHQMLILFSILGGLAYFGPAGFLFGPIALSLFIALFQIYKTLISDPTDLKITPKELEQGSPS